MLIHTCRLLIASHWLDTLPWLADIGCHYYFIAMPADNIDTQLKATILADTHIDSYLSYCQYTYFTLLITFSMLLHYWPHWLSPHIHSFLPLQSLLLAIRHCWCHYYPQIDSHIITASLRHCIFILHYYGHWCHWGTLLLATDSFKAGDAIVFLFQPYWLPSLDFLFAGWYYEAVITPFLHIGIDVSHCFSLQPLIYFH